MGFVVILSLDVSTGSLRTGSLARGRAKYDVGVRDRFTYESVMCGATRDVR